jgi:hypothetical protein
MSESGGNISFTCACGQAITVPADKAGAKGRCKTCGRTVVVPAFTEVRRTKDEGRREKDEERRAKDEEGGEKDEMAAAARADYLPPVMRRDLQEKYSEEDLITYPEIAPVKPPAPPPVDALREKPSLLHMLGDILEYPLSNKQAAQIFLTGAVLFSPLVWKPLLILNFIPGYSCVFLLLRYVVTGLIVIVVVSVRLMYFSYLLLVIEKSAEGRRKIPELPVFSTWEENLNDLLKVLGASAIAFSPYLVYSLASNIEFMAHMAESAARGAPPGSEELGGASSTLGMLMLLYAIAAFYMPMVLMTLVVTKNFLKAINPLFIFRSILRIRREYLAAMVIIFLLLRGSLTAFTIVADVLDAGWFTSLAGNVAEPVIEFYALVVTMHVIGLLYYRNGDKLRW